MSGSEKEEATAVSGNGGSHPSRWRQVIRIGLIILGCVLLGWALKEAWGSVIDREKVESFFDSLNESKWMIPVLFAVFLGSGVVGISLNLLLVAATLVIGPWAALGCGFTGSLLSAILVFYLGIYLGQSSLQKYFGQRLDVVRKKVEGRGLIAVALLRLFPIAPFPVVNVAAGLARLGFCEFAGGTCLGMLPGMAGVVLVTHQARNVYDGGSWENWVWLGLGVLVLVGLTFGVRRKWR